MTLKNLVVLGLIIGAVAWYSNKQQTVDPALPGNAESESLLAERPAEFRCEGKTHCSQMATCAEAMFYLQNCPGTKMDGDRDGIPCESQLCSD